MRNYWPPPTRRRRPEDDPPPSPEHLAYVAGLRRKAAAFNASDFGMKPCPRCGGTEGVGISRPPRTHRRDSFRLKQGIHPECGYAGPRVYGGIQDAVNAWNAVDRSHLPIQEPS